MFTDKESKHHLKRLSAVEKEFLEETKKSIQFKNIWNKEERSFSSPFEYSLEGASFTLIGNKIFIFGGRNKTTYENYIYTYDLNLQIWDYKEEKIKGRAYHTTCVLNDIIYMFGGQMDDSISNELYFYDHTFQLISCTSDVISPRSKHTMVSWKNSLIVFGGYPNMDSGVYIFDKDWSKLETSGDIPQARYSHATIVSQDIMYIFGGYTSKDVASKDIYQLDLKSNIWKKLSVSLPIAAPLCSTVFEDHFYLLPKNNMINNGIIRFNTKNQETKVIETFGDIPKDFDNCILYNNCIYTLSKTELSLLHLQEVHNYHFLMVMLKKDLYCDVIIYIKEKKYHCHKYLSKYSDF